MTHCPQPVRLPRARRSSPGFSLVELMIAMVVLAVGLLAAAGLICAALKTSAVPKIGSTSATLAESTMERIMAVPPDATGAAAATNIADCAGNNFTINTLVGPPGSTLITSQNEVSVDFQQPPVPGYSMQYVVCSSGQNTTYDVRWVIEAGPTPSTQLITVSARLLPGSAGPQGIYTRTATLRSLRGGA